MISAAQVGPGRMGDWLGRAADALSGVALEQVVLVLAAALLVFAAVRLFRRWAERQVEDVNRRHQLRKAASYTGGLIVLVFALGLFVGRFGQLATVLGLVGAGLAIALQDVGKSVAGWVYLATRAGFGPGARIEVDGLEGEVIDVGILKTTVLEVGNLVHGRQSSGRLATIPNSKLLNQNVFVSPTYALYAWQEIQFRLTYESDWRKAVELLEEFAEEEDRGVETAVGRAFRELERRFAFKYGPRTAIVYVTTADSGVLLTLRHLTHIRERRGAKDRITRAMLEAVEREPDLEFAYPTKRIYRRDVEGGPAAPGEAGG